MADLGTLITIAEKVFQLLQSPVLQDMKNWQSDLENLNKSVRSIKNLLLVADTKPELSPVEKGWVDDLNEVLYEADDLFDEVITIAKQKELNAAGAKFSKKVLDKVNIVRKEKALADDGETAVHVSNAESKTVKATQEDVMPAENGFIANQQSEDNVIGSPDNRSKENHFDRQLLIQMHQVVPSSLGVTGLC